MGCCEGDELDCVRVFRLGLAVIRESLSSEMFGEAGAERDLLRFPACA